MSHDDNPLADLSVIGGRLCLDFLNTVDTHDTLLEEKFGVYADLVWWALHVGLMTDADAAPLFAAAEAEPRRAADVFARAMELREALFRLFMAARAGEGAASADVAFVNGAIERTLGHQRIAATDEGFAWGWEDGVELERVLWAVVRDAADLLVSGDLRRVGKCCGTNCDWLYLDTSRNRSRRWCDMQLCGNRAKARRYYHKAKGGG